MGRLEDQKGVDLIVAGLPALMAPRPASLPSGLQLPPMDDPLVLTALGAPGAMPYQPSGLMRKALQLLAEVQVH